MSPRHRTAVLVAALTAVLTATAAGLAAATDPRPAAGAAVGAASVGGGAAETAVDLFYVRADRGVTQKNGAGVADLGGVVTSGVAALAVGTGASATTTVWGRGADNGVWVRTRVGGGAWQAWRTIGGRSAGAPAVTCSAGGTGEPPVFMRGTDGALHRYAAGAWVRKPGLTLASDPAGVASVGGRCPATESVFALGSDGAVWEWSGAGWRKVGGRSTVAPSATLLPDGSVDLFARGPDNAAWVSRRPPGAATFPAFVRVGGTFTSPVTGFVDTTAPADRLVLGVGADGDLSIGGDELGGPAAWVWSEVP